MNLKKSFIKVIILALVIILSLSACSGDSNKPSASVSGSNSTSSTSNEKKATSNKSADWPDTPVSDFSYKYDGELKGVVITDYKGENALKVRIPDTIEGEPVVGITIGKDKGSYVTGAFYQAGIMAVHFPDTLKIITGHHVFAESGLTSLDLPNGLTEIGQWAFAGCDGLTEVTIPASVVNLDVSAFVGNVNMTHIYVSPDNTTYADIDGVVFSKDKTELLIYPSGRTDESYTVPDGVTTLGFEAFGKEHLAEETLLKSVVLPNSIVNIRRCGLSIDSFDDATMKRLIEAGAFEPTNGGALPPGYFCDSCGAPIGALPCICESCGAVVRYGVNK